MSAILPVKYVKSFKVKDAFGEPRAFLNAMPKTDKGVPVAGSYARMGVVIGTVEGLTISKRENNQGGYDYWAGFVGTFEGQPNDPMTVHTVRSAKAWLAEEISAAIYPLLKDQFDKRTGQISENEDGSDSVGIAYEVGIEASDKSTAGFIYRWTPLMNLSTEAVDPLAQLRNMIPQDKLPLALPAPKTDDGMVEPQPDAADLGDTAAEEAATQESSGDAGTAAVGRNKRK